MSHVSFLRMILLFGFMISSVEGSWKLNQNKTAEARLDVIAAPKAKDGAAGEIACTTRHPD